MISMNAIYKNKSSLLTISSSQIKEKIDDINKNDNNNEEVEAITKKVVKEDPKAKENYTLFKKYNGKVKGIIVDLIILDILVTIILYILFKRKKKKTKMKTGDKYEKEK